jgi:hypothetical protein
MSVFGQILGGLIGGGGSGFGTMGNYSNTSALNASIDARIAGQTARDAQEHVTELGQRLDHLTLVCMAMWELMKQSGLTEEQLAQKVKELDLLDGRADNKLSPPAEVSHCPKCRHVMSRRHARCLYCGNEDLQAKPFDATM